MEFDEYLRTILMDQIGMFYTNNTGIIFVECVFGKYIWYSPVTGQGTVLVKADISPKDIEAYGYVKIGSYILKDKIPGEIQIGFETIREKVLNTVGTFKWDLNAKFWIFTDIGTFIWENPRFNGSNTLVETTMYPMEKEIFDIGTWKIRDMCGDNVLFG